MAKINLGAVEKIELFKEIVFFWSQALNGGEFKVVVWLLCNTVGRGKDRGRYSLKQITEGIPKLPKIGEDGFETHEDDWWCGGVGMSLSSVRRALDTLIARGIVRRLDMSGRGTEYSVNLDWEPTLR